MKEIQRDLNALVILILSGVLLGAFGVQFFWKEEPCPLCMLQRLGMISVTASLTMNIKFGVKITHYALGLISSFMGGFVALRQISLHVCPGFTEFGLPVLGLSLYTWSFIVFVCCVLAISFLMFLYDPKQDEESPPLLNYWSKAVCGIIFLITVTNIITTFAQCGWGSC